MWGEPAEVLNEEYAIRYIPTRVGRTRPSRPSTRSATVHPHACGGERRSSGPRRPHPRYIPTRVGRTKFSSCCRTVSTVHPHACGENEEPDYNGVDDFGTSPRVWGEREAGNGEAVGVRYIPTRVGRTVTPGPVKPKFPVHPHACGENYRASMVSLPVTGTSPRVWGEHYSASSPAPARRYIPTRVGRTFYSFRSRCYLTVHPHACGENFSASTEPSLYFGTSPRVWGERHEIRTVDLDKRYIPTRVGRTTPSRHRAACLSVHPHACGENDFVGARLPELRGTSPRVWGERGRADVRGGSDRYIPTRVGRTPSCSGSSNPATVHPHACGENQVDLVGEVDGLGTSPRVWGEPGRSRRGG